LAYHGQPPHRRLYAIPTDVEELRHYRNVKLHNADIVATSLDGNGNLNFVEGTICCAVQRPAGGPVYLLGCHHVFALSKILPNVPPNVELVGAPPPGQPPRIARSSGFFGYIDSEGFFLDSALLTLDQPMNTRQYVPDPTPANGIVSRVVDLASLASIHITPTNQVPVEMFKAWFNFDQPWYPWQVRQKWVVEYHFTTGAATAEGNSGSPVFNVSASAFQGMHIAGNETSAFALPAFELLRASHYGITTGDERLQLV
jgi:hypothetical protein